MSAYLTLMPLLWLLGVHAALAAILVLWLASRRWPSESMVNLVAFAWCLVAVAQALAVLYNWSLAGEPMGQLLGRLAAFPIVGWAILAIALGAGHAWRLAEPRLVRGVMALGLHVAIFSTLSLAVALLAEVPQLEIPTPVKLALGSRPAIDFYASAIFYLEAEGSFGLPRLVLFFPWSTCLGFAGICIGLIATCEGDRRWRLAGYAGCLCAVAFSFSRAAAVTLPMAFAVIVALRARPAVLAGIVLAASGVGLALVLLELGPDEILQSAMSTLHDSRAGSSQARELIYDYSWQGFLQSPLFGQGWIGESVIPQEDLPIGSHSTVYGVLYTGGLATFSFLVLAFVATISTTLAIVLWRRTPEAAAAAGMLVAFLMFAYGEGLYNLVLPCLFAFLFIGGALAGPSQAKRARA